MSKWYALIMQADGPMTDALEGATSSFDLSHYLDAAGKTDISFFLFAGTDSGTSPTLDCKIQWSANNSDWEDGVSFTQITTTDASEMKASTFVARYVRGFFTVTGSSTPSYASCYLHANFMLRAGGGAPNS
jgi:hypothetical protein